ncbi:MAG: hypothetical protein CSB55_00845 [Candidatus Cloacimonadota bacterium]|nr:MAG: hypothetical protein CSB55_00845 [Candidatus Cloacimonadota bacterium]
MKNVSGNQFKNIIPLKSGKHKSFSQKSYVRQMSFRDYFNKIDGEKLKEKLNMKYLFDSKDETPSIEEKSFGKSSSLKSKDKEISEFAITEELPFASEVASDNIKSSQQEKFLRDTDITARENETKPVKKTISKAKYSSEYQNIKTNKDILSVNKSEFDRNEKIKDNSLPESSFKLKTNKNSSIISDIIKSPEYKITAEKYSSEKHENIWGKFDKTDKKDSKPVFNFSKKSSELNINLSSEKDASPDIKKDKGNEKTIGEQYSKEFDSSLKLGAESDPKYRKTVFRLQEKRIADPDYENTLKEKRKKDIVEILGHKEINSLPEYRRAENSSHPKDQFDPVTNWRKQQSNEAIQKKVETEIKLESVKGEISYASVISSENKIKADEKIRKNTDGRNSSFVNLLKVKKSSVLSEFKIHAGKVSESEAKKSDARRENSEKKFKSERNKISKTNQRKPDENKSGKSPEEFVLQRNTDVESARNINYADRVNTKRLPGYNEKFLARLSNEIIKFTTGKRWAEFEIDHEKLGKILTKIEKNEKGLKIIFNVKNRETLTELKDLLPEMKENLAKQGFRTQEFSFSGNQNEKKGFEENSKRKYQSVKLKTEEIFEDKTKIITSKKLSYNTVEYIA